jgi:alpha-L-fucosidase
LIENYRPDLIWFDFGINFVLEEYRKELLAHYYNKETEWGRELAVTYKGHDLGTGSAIIDYELGRMDNLTYYDWITDTSVDDQGAWSYVPDAAFKKVSTLVHNLIDNVSKNGYLLLNVGPKLDGTIPEGAKKCLTGIGKWLQVNGEAIFAAEPWLSYGEGPTKMETSGMFSEQREVEYTDEDFRFTCRGNLLYATCLGWPGKRVTIRSMKKLYPGEIESVRMLGVDAELNWSVTEEGLEIDPPGEKPCEEAFVFKITRKNPF